MAEAPIAGTTLFYDDRGGDGPPCLVIHGGLGMDHTYMAGAFDRLGARVRLVYYDQRANGRSAGAPLETVTLEQLADDAAALADHLGIDRFIALGHSYGGFVAQELALRHPDRLLGVALLNTTPGQLGTGESETGQGAPPSPEQQAAMQSPVATDDEMAALMDRLAPFYLYRLDPDVLRQAMADTVFRVATMVQGFVATGKWSTVDRLSSIACPTLVVGGAHDTFTSAPQSYRIASRVPNAELHIFGESGHFPWLEEPAAFWSALEQWLDARVLAR